MEAEKELHKLPTGNGGNVRCGDARNVREEERRRKWKQRRSCIS